MGFLWRVSAAISSRLVFVGHAIWSLNEILARIYIDDVYFFKNSNYWTLTLILALIVIEGGYTLVVRKGHEYKL